MTATTEFQSVGDILGKTGLLSGLQSVSDAEIIESGHIVYMALDGKAYDLDIQTQENIDDYRLCPKCHAPHYINWVKAPKDVGGNFIAMRCMTPGCRVERECNQCGIKRHEKETRALERAKETDHLKRYGVPDGYRHCTLDNFSDHGDFRQAIDCTIEAIRFMDADPVRSFLITGNTGTGKTHIAVGILRRFAQAGCTSMRFESAALVWSRFKITYSPQHEGSEYDLIREYGGYTVLVIDDLGVENRSSASVTIVQQIVEERCSRLNGKLIITSNFTAEKLAQAYGDRMLSRLTGTTGKVLHITAPDYRKARKA